MPNKQAVVVHSGGMDSSLCLALAIEEFKVQNVLSLTFDYHQRHRGELIQAQKICKDWGVDHITLDLSCLKEITRNALVDHTLEISQSQGEPPNTLVVGRNGLMGRIAGIHAHSLGAGCIYMGVLELETANSGYRDCSRHYIDLLQNILRIDFDNPDFEIKTPLVHMTKQETLERAASLGLLDYLLENCITCYQGVPFWGCGECPSCHLRNEGIRDYQKAHPAYAIPY